ncbi:MAG: TetR/AcrR family transcriptional regulator [Betaproteobacteria bacterium]|nr:TetR/AcrR family transcriptional regulator [Betaproteobacteria bacterium]
MLHASARLFREKGYDGTSVRDIAQATGMQSGSWVYHFATKQDILAAVMHEGLVAALARIEAIAAAQLPPRAAFERLVRTHLDTLLGPGQDFIPVVLYEWRSLEPGPRRRIKVLLRRYEAIWQDVIAALQQEGAWPGRTKVDALLLFGALNWIARWYDPRGALDVEALAQQCIAFFLREMAAPARGKATRRAPARARK